MVWQGTVTPPTSVTIGSIPIISTRTFRVSPDTVTHRMRSSVTTTGGSLRTQRPLAMRERSLSGSGWKVRVMGTIASYLDVLQLPPGDAEHFVFIVKHRYRYRDGTLSLFGPNCARNRS